MLVGDESVGLGVVVELRARIGVRNGDLDGFHIQRLGKVDGVADRLLRLAGQAENEVAVDRQAQVVAVLGKRPRALNGGALLDVLQNLRIARLKSHNQQPAAGFLHRLQRVASVVTREVQLQVRPSGFSFSHSSMVRTF